MEQMRFIVLRDIDFDCTYYDLIVFPLWSGWLVGEYVQ